MDPPPDPGTHAEPPRDDDTGEDPVLGETTSQNNGGETDTGIDPPLEPGDTGSQDPPPVEPPLVAHLTVDLEEGEYPLEVSFDASESELGARSVRYQWSFGDGQEAEGLTSLAHTYVGKGEFEATLTLVDEVTGEFSTAVLTIDVDKPSCPTEAAPVPWGTLPGGLNAVSGLTASHRAPDLLWLQQDNEDELAVVDSLGVTISEHGLPAVEDLEDIAAAVDPKTGISWLFIADIGDNILVRDHVEVWVVEEPDPFRDSELDPLRMELDYPDGPHDAETLLIDPLTLDLFIVTKDLGGVNQSVYVKRAPHDDVGPFALDALGSYAELDMRATGGDVSADGFRIVVRDYTPTARMWFRDGYEPFEAAFEDEPCRISIFNELQGEGAAFTADGRGIVTVSEGASVPLYFIEL